MSFAIFETFDNKNNTDENFIGKQIIWDHFYFSFEQKTILNKNFILKEIYFNKNYINSLSNDDELYKIYDQNIFNRLIASANQNLILNPINNKNPSFKAKYFRFNIKFDLIRLKKIEKLLKENQKDFFSIINNNSIEDYFNNIDNKKIYVNLLDYFITFAKKLFIIHNHLNLKIYFNNEKFTQNPNIVREIDYKLIYEEVFDNIARINFYNLDNFLSQYLKIEKENIYKIKGDNVTLILSFCEYKANRKDECNNLEILFVDKQHKNLLIGEDHLNFLNNFVEENICFKTFFAKFDIILDNPKAFVDKINNNNPFKREISSNYLDSNQIDINFLNESKFKYVF